MATADEAVYYENGNVARAMWEWRHKLLTLYVVAMGTVASAVLWLHEQRNLEVVSVPLFIGSAITCALGLMDARSSEVLRACYEVGDILERRLVDDDGIFSRLLARSRGKGVTYGRVLRCVYAGSAVVLLASALMTM